jgi:isopentenyl-diphosphate delta-isomerase
MNSAASRIVSSDEERLILVDEHDREIGQLDKAACHDGSGILHRAFSLFIFNDDGDLLLQQRSAGKRLWPLYWSNSCCSHPRVGESMPQATARRLRDELDIEADLEFVYKFRYQADFGHLGAEHELCWVYLGRSGQDPTPNSHEIASLRSVPADRLDAELEATPELFTPWFRLEWQRFRREHAALLGKYSAPRQP